MLSTYFATSSFAEAPMADGPWADAPAQLAFLLQQRYLVHFKEVQEVLCQQRRAFEDALERDLMKVRSNDASAAGKRLEAVNVELDGMASANSPRKMEGRNQKIVDISIETVSEDGPSGVRAPGASPARSPAPSVLSGFATHASAQPPTPDPSAPPPTSSCVPSTLVLVVPQADVLAGEFANGIQEQAVAHTCELNVHSVQGVVHQAENSYLSPVATERSYREGLDARDAREREIQVKGRLRYELLRINDSHWFQGITMLAVIANGILLGIVADQDVQSALSGQGIVPWEDEMDTIFCVVFSVEIAIRIAAERADFFSGNHYRWNTFDFIVVGFMLFEYAVSGMNMTFTRSLRVLRVLKVIRALRLFKFLREVRLMAVSILCCGPALFWACVLLIISVYLFAVFLCEGSRGYLREHMDGGGDEELVVALQEYANGIGMTMLFIFIAIMGGFDWYDLAGPFMKIGAVYGFGFLVFICFVLLGMMNILTGLFVTSAHDLATMDQDLVTEAQIEEQNSSLNQLKKFFSELDDDKSGAISWDELQAHMDDIRVTTFFNNIDIRPQQAHELFDILDSNGTGQVEISEFIEGCTHVRGGAKSIDMIKVLQHIQLLHEKLNRLSR